MIVAHWLKTLVRRNRSMQAADRPSGSVLIRRRRRVGRLTVAGVVESLEDRTVLAAVIPGFDTHGLVFNNAAAAGKSSITVTSADNAKLSNNAQGSGLFINLNGQGGALPGLKSISITNVTVANNGNAGVQIRLANLTLDSLIIDRAKITGSGGSGLVIDLTNSVIKELVIYDSTNVASPAIANSGASRISGNAFDGVNFTARNSKINTLGLAGNVVENNAGHGMLFDLENTPILVLGVTDNEVRNNTNGSGIHFDTNRSSVGSTTGAVRFNTFSGNSSHGLSFLGQSLQANAQPTPSTSNFDFAFFSNNSFLNNGGSGVSVDIRAQATWDGTLLRNTFTGNQFRGFDLKAADTGTVTVDPNTGDFLPSSLAFNVQLGDLTTNTQQTLINANRFNQNRGAGIALELNDTTDLSGHTTGRFRILGNTITGTIADTDPNSDLYNGHGIVVVASGSVALQNGSAIYSNSTIDRNTLSGNAGDGLRVRISEDSEFNGLTIGNTTGVNQAFDVNGNFSGGGNVTARGGDGNVIDNNGGDGIAVERLNSAIVQNVRILDNRITRNDRGVFLRAAGTYETVPESPRPLLEVVNTFTVDNNDLSNNRLDGVHLQTEFNAVLSADMRYNRINANGANGIRVTGIENNFADFENVGGTWIKNAITNNAQNGIEIQTVVGSVNPLIIGRDGRDGADNQSLGNFIYRNGVDGIEVGSRPGLGGTETPRDIRDAMDIINNQIIENGRNAVGSPYTAGKGIDIEVLISSPREFRIDRNVIQGNAGDGIELRNAGGMLRVTAEGNFIDLNGGRGVDLLNQIGLINYNAEAFIHFGDVGTTLAGGVAVSNRNTITNNGLEGFYVVNTAAPSQTQDVSNESTPFDTTTNVDVLGSAAVNLVLDLENNVIRDNGNGVPGLNNSPPSTLSGTGLVLNIGTQVSAVSISTAPDLLGNASYFTNDDFTGSRTDAARAGVGSNRIQGPGTVGILQQDSGGISTSANGRVNARVVGNEFSGNGGDDVFVQSFTSLIPHATDITFNDQEFTLRHYDRDPLARLNMVFTGNTLDSLDVNRGVFSSDNTNAGAYYTNAEGELKSRTPKPNSPNPDGPFGNAGRTRNGQRVSVLGYTTDTQLPNGRPDFYFDGLGPSTFRIEDSWRGSNILRGNQLGDTFDDFYAETPRGINEAPIGDFAYEWDDVSSNTFSFLTASISDATFNEAAGFATLTVTLTEDAPVGGVTLFYRTSDGTAKADPNNDGNTADGDYVAVNSASVFIPAGSRTATIQIQLNPDSVLDPGERFYVDLYQTSQGDFIDSRGVVTVQEPPVLSISDAQVVEGDPNDQNNGVRLITFTVTLSADPGAAVTVNYTVNPGTATTPADYNGTSDPLSGQITFPSGTLTQTITIAVVGDAAFENDETFSVVLSGAVGATISDATGVGTIVDNDTPVISINDRTVTETPGGTTVTFTVSLDKPATAGFPVTVNYSVGGTATAGSDYGPGSPASPITFTAGQSSKTITFTVLNDATIEGAETIVVSLSGASNAVIGDGVGVATILDDDAPTVSVGDVTATEGDGGVRTATFTVTLSKPAVAGFPVSVNYTTADLTATSGSDYQTVSGTVTFVAGDPVSKTVSVNIVGDLLPEPTQTFALNLTAASNASISDAQGVATIVDDDTPSISVRDVGAIESDGFVDVVVSLSKAVGVPVTVDYNVLPGTAQAGSDYDGTLSALTGTLSFAAGVRTQTVRVRILSGGGAEPVETFSVQLSNPTGGVISDGLGIVRIVDPSSTIGLVTSPNAGTEPRVFVFDAAGTPRLNPSFYAYSPAFTNGVRVATGDVDGDGVTDIVVAPVSGVAPIRVFRSDSYAEIANFFPFAPGYTGGVSIATGDINLDGKAEIFASTTSTNPADGGTSVRIFAVVNRTGVLADPSSSFFAFAPHFTGGALIAAGDVNGDGRADAVVTPVSGAGPAVAMFDYAGTFINSFFAFDPSFTGGANIAVGDVNGDGRADVIASVRSGAQPAVRVFSGFSGTPLSSFLAFSPAFFGGVNIGVGDINFDGRADVIAAPASGPAGVRFFDGLSGAVLKSVTPSYPSTFTNGIFVAGQLINNIGQPLQLAGSAVEGAAATAVTQAQVQTLAKAAIAKLTAAGGAAAAAKLASVQITIADLPANYLGVARTGSIVIDLNAGGLGWFVDATPFLDEEFVQGADGVARALAPQAQGKVDLLTVLTHELAHLLGFEDVDSAVAPNSLMTSTVTGGVRRATREHLDDLFADGDVLSELLTV